MGATPARKIKLPRKQRKHNDDTVTWIIHSCSASSTESFSRHLRAARFHSKIHRPRRPPPRRESVPDAPTWIPRHCESFFSPPYAHDFPRVHNLANNKNLLSRGTAKRSRWRKAVSSRIHNQSHCRVRRIFLLVYKHSTSCFKYSRNVRTFTDVLYLIMYEN